MDPIAAREFLLGGSSLAPPPTNLTAGQLLQTPPPSMLPLLPGTNETQNFGEFLKQDLARQAQENPVQRLNAAREAQYQAQNQVPGVPLDTATGATPWDRFMVGMSHQKKDQLNYLQNKYGPENVRLDSEGDFVFRSRNQETGESKDIKVHPRGMSAGDVLDIAAQAPELIGSLLSIRGARGIPAVGKATGLGGLTRDVLAGAIGAEATGAAKDITMGLAGRGEADVGDILKDRGKQAVVDAGVGAVTMGAGQALKFMGAPLSGSRGPVQFDAAAAQKYFRDKYGIQVPLTVAESTGSHLAGRTEAFVEMQPAGSGPFTKLKQSQEDSLRKLQDIMMGGTPTSTATPVADEALGNRLIANLEGKIAPLEKAASEGAAAVNKSATGQIESIASGLTTPARQLEISKTGEELRKGVIARRDAAKAEADRLYEAVRTAEGGMGRVFEGKGLQNRLNTILKKLPGVQSTKEVPGFDAYGSPTVKSVTTSELLEKSAPDKIIGRIREIVGKKDAKFSLSDLQQLRRDIYDDIARGEGVPGLGVHYLNDFANAVTQSIEEEIKKMPTGGLKTALEAANKHYKEKVVPFNRTGLTELFRNADEPGFVPGDQIVANIFGGGKALNNYNVLKETLGASSPEFVKLKRAILDKLLENGRSMDGKLFDAEALIGSFAKFQKDNREIANDLFGTKLNNIFKEAKFIDYADPHSAGKKISGDDLVALMKDPSPTASKLNDFIAAQRKLDDVYRNSILRDVAANKLPKGEINPDEFVSRFVNNTKSSTADVKKVLDLLKDDPALVEDLKTKTVEQLFRNAGRKATANDINRLMAGDPTRIVTGTGVFQQIGDPATREKIKAILGPEVYKDLENYIKLETATEAKYAAGGYKMAGAFAASEKVSQLERGQFGKYFKGSALNYLVANFITRAPFRQWLSRMPSSDQPQYLSLLLTSPIFLQQVAKDFPGAPGAAFVSSLKDSLDRWVSDEAKQKPAVDQSGGDLRRKLMQDFLHGKTTTPP